jgi:hypothetical protein
LHSGFEPGSPLRPPAQPPSCSSTRGDSEAGRRIAAAARCASAPTTFDAWREAVARPGFSAAAHCDAVVDVDRDGGKREVVGGNVLQSVARRRLWLDGDHLLSDVHYRGETPAAGQEAGCDDEPVCATPNLNLQYWSVLLRLQPDN